MGEPGDQIDLFIEVEVDPPIHAVQAQKHAQLHVQTKGR